MIPTWNKNLVIYNTKIPTNVDSYPIGNGNLVIYNTQIPTNVDKNNKLSYIYGYIKQLNSY